MKWHRVRDLWEACQVGGPWEVFKTTGMLGIASAITRHPNPETISLLPILDCNCYIAMRVEYLTFSSSLTAMQLDVIACGAPQTRRPRSGRLFHWPAASCSLPLRYIVTCFTYGTSSGILTVWKNVHTPKPVFAA